MEIASGGQTQHGGPHIYRVKQTTRRFLYGLSLLLVAFFFVMTVVHLEGFMRRPLSLSQLIAIDSFFTLFALLVCANASRRVLVYENAIEVAGWLSTRKLLRQDILGRRMGRQRSSKLDRKRKCSRHCCWLTWCGAEKSRWV